jgi:hypothetical protein
VANLVNNDDTVTIAMSALEKAGALHRDLTFPRSAVTGAEVVANALAGVHGLKMPGASIPWVIMVGSWLSPAGHTLAGLIPAW